MPDPILIKFTTDIGALETAVDQLEQLGQVDKAVADEFRKGAAKIREQNAELQKTGKQVDTLTLDLDQMAKAMKGLPKKILDDAAKKGLEDTVTVTTKLTTQLRAMKNELSQLETAGKANTARYRELAIAAGKLEDQIGDTGKRIRTLASDSRNLDAALSIATGVAGGFAVAQGAAALFGGENEELQKTLLRVQAALSILNGLQAIAATVNKDSAASVVLGNISLKQGSVLQTLYSFAVGRTTAVTTASTIAARAFRTALLLTGVGAVVVLLAAAANAMGLFSSSTDDATESLEDQKAAVDELNSSLREQFEIQQRGRTDAINKLQREIDLRKSQGETDENIFKLENEQIDLQIQKQRVLAETLAQGTQEQFQAAEELKNLTNEKYILAATLLKKQNDDEKKAADDSVKTEAERLKDIEKLREEQLKTRNEMLKAQAIGTAEFFNQEARNVVTAFQGVFDVLGIDFSADYRENIIDPVLKLNQEYYDEINRRYDEQRKKEKEAADLEKAELEAKWQAFGAIVANGFDIIQNIQNKKLQDELAGFQAQLDSKQLSQAEFDKKVAAAKRKAAIQNKILSIAEAGINIAASIIKTGATLGYPAAIPFQLLAGIVGLLEIAKIASTPIPAFKSGTKKAPPGWKLVGEEGPELINDKGGYAIKPHKESMALMAAYAKGPQVNITPMPAFGSLSEALNESNGELIDYEKLAAAVTKRIEKLPLHSTHITGDGIMNIVKKGNITEKQMDDRYSS